MTGALQETDRAEWRGWEDVAARAGKAFGSLVPVLHRRLRRAGCERKAALSRQLTGRASAGGRATPVAAGSRARAQHLSGCL